MVYTYVHIQLIKIIKREVKINVITDNEDSYLMDLDGMEIKLHLMYVYKCDYLCMYIIYVRISSMYVYYLIYVCISSMYLYHQLQHFYNRSANSIKLK